MKPERKLIDKTTIESLTEIQLREYVSSLGLTELQRRFSEEYLVDFDRPRAMIAAGYSTVSVGGEGGPDDPLMNERVLVYIDILKVKLAQRLNLTAEAILKEHMQIAFANPEDFVDWSAKAISLKDSSTIPRSKKAAVAEVSYTETKNGGITKIKFHNKQASLAELMKYVTLQEDQRKRRESREAQGLDMESVRVMLGDGQTRMALEFLSARFFGKDITGHTSKFLERVNDMVKKVTAGKAAESLPDGIEVDPEAVDV